MRDIFAMQHVMDGLQRVHRHLLRLHRLLQWPWPDKVRHGAGNHQRIRSARAGLLSDEQTGTRLSVPHRTCNTVFITAADRDVHQLSHMAEKETRLPRCIDHSTK